MHRCSHSRNREVPLFEANRRHSRASRTIITGIPRENNVPVAAFGQIAIASFERNCSSGRRRCAQSDQQIAREIRGLCIRMCGANSTFSLRRKPISRASAAESREPLTLYRGLTAAAAIKILSQSVFAERCALGALHNASLVAPENERVERPSDNETRKTAPSR